ncbi:hypothetical protein GCM10011506_05150 [Marivirga lumbricoides]|uniref:Uncharacterized protein n=1 Tax=Marivirga lumbricoides TaxID=1046115 RepID=A0ABQ1LIL4_9BACT|nr:hypothetical protein GCM10011506_05150 [Marivirga lumbricoides]
MNILGVIITGLGSFAFGSREIIISGHIALTVGIVGLIFKKDKGILSLIN